ncbi:MAG: carbon monoxide dehydrogenase subunit G [Dehalococcoidia bacterium]
MRLDGRHSFDAPLQQVWDTLLDPSAIAACIPGCDKFEQTGPDQYEVTMRLKIGAISGAATGRVRLLDQLPPHRYRMEVEGGGGPGQATGAGNMALSEEGGRTVVAYSGEVQVTGKAASVGQRLLGATAKLLIGQFFKCMESKVGRGAREAPEASRP